MSAVTQQAFDSSGIDCNVMTESGRSSTFTALTFMRPRVRSIPPGAALK